MAAFEGERGNIRTVLIKFYKIYTSEETFGSVQREEVFLKCLKFIREFRFKDSFVYRNQLMNNVANQLYYLQVEINDIQNFDSNLSIYMTQRPQETQSLFEEAIRRCYCDFDRKPYDDPIDFQLQLVSKQTPKMLRDLKSHLLGQLVSVSGLIVSLTKSYLKAKKLVVVCKACQDKQEIDFGNGLSGVPIPRLCRSKDKAQGVGNKEQCPMDSYVIVPEQCLMIDQQILRIQESPESIPTGEIPRNFQLCVDRYFVNQLVPGQRVEITGIYQVQSRGNVSTTRGKNSNQSQLRIPYIHVLGTQLTSRRYGDSNSSQAISQDEIYFLKQLVRKPDLHKTLINSIAPAIYGHEDIKLALACLLFGGSSKILPDLMRLRGDINVLLIGDPSTAKSQLLKFIERVSDISVYTSGKGSSAAGLTATITRQGASGQFSLEAGALVLASGGVCCIDEFDKMRPEDRVVMHEAMEQQTISVAKAGITTRLNAKCSILAAANPIFGRYEDGKSITDQIELQTTILSRFDCIFIVRDQRTVESDTRIAKHVLNNHMNKKESQMEEEQQRLAGGQLDMNMLRAYIKYAKSLPTPRLNALSAQIIENLYVQDRQKSEAQGHHKTHGGKSHIPITVRQLEAIIRLSEALAKIELKSEVEEKHVKEAHRLFQNSTMQAVSLGAKEFGLDLPAELRSLANQIEEVVKRKLPIGAQILQQRLKDELVQRFNNMRVVDFSIKQMIQQEELQEIQNRKVVVRKK